MSTRPYPFERLQKLSRTQLRTLAGLRAFYDPRGLANALQTAGSLLGASVSLRAGPTSFFEAETVVTRLAALGPCVGVLLEPPGGALDAGIVLELSAAFAERLVDRTLGGEDNAAFIPTLLPADPLACGALAYLAARMLAALDSSLRLRHVTSDLQPIVASFSEQPLLVCPFEVQLGSDSGSARLYVPQALLQPPRVLARVDLQALPLTLIANLGSAWLQRAELRELRLADVVVLDRCALMFDGSGFAGQLLVHVAGSRSHLVCSVRDRSLQVESLRPAMEPPMTTGRLSQPPGTGPTLATTPNLADDAPLELQVELARFSLTLGELQRTQPGDVLVTGRRIGEAVTLRVAGRALAQGELVDVEGEIGVRITQFLSASE
jgi:type III secretion system YscQ/HrcQ family protein